MLLICNKTEFLVYNTSSLYGQIIPLINIHFADIDWTTYFDLIIINVENNICRQL